LVTFRLLGVVFDVFIVGFYRDVKLVGSPAEAGVSLGHHFPSRLAGMGPASVSKNPKRGSKSCIARHMPFKKMPPII
jgi:hypothetical protein